MPWLSEEWKYRFPVRIINNVSEDLEEYQVLVSFNHSELVSEGKSKPDASDIVVTDSDGVTKLYFYIEKETINTNRCRLWVRVPRIPANGENTIYVYYGNPNATKTPYHDPERTFEFFDDFNGTELDNRKWTPNFVNSVFYVVNNSVLRIEDATKNVNMYWIYDNTDTGSQIKMNFTPLDKMVIEFSMRMPTQRDASALGEVGIGFCKSTDHTVHVYSEQHDGLAREIQYKCGTYDFIENVKSNTVDIIPNKWYRHVIRKIDTRFEIEDPSGFISGTSTNADYIAICVGAYGGYPFTPIEIDWVMVRKYCEPEPTVEIGAEETICKVVTFNVLDINGMHLRNLMVKVGDSDWVEKNSPFDIHILRDTIVKIWKEHYKMWVGLVKAETHVETIVLKQIYLDILERIENAVELIRKINTNRWQLKDEELIIYDDDGVTPLVKFKLYDKHGRPSSTEIYDKRPA